MIGKELKDIKRERIQKLVGEYNQLFSDGKVKHKTICLRLNINESTFLRWRTFKSIPSRRMIERLEIELRKLKG